LNAQLIEPVGGLLIRRPEKAKNFLAFLHLA
jgi:hypothetical protein